MHTGDARFPKKALGIVALVAIAIRVLLWLFYQPVAYSDTPSYRRLAESVLNGFQRYDGTRTPGYPVFLAFVGNDQNVFLAQLFLGLLTTLLIFWIAWQLTSSIWLASVAGLAHTLNLGQLFFEANLLTETLTTFWILLALSGIILLSTRAKPSLWLAAGIGLSSTLAAITRPLFIYLPFWLILFVIWHALHKPSSEVPFANLQHKRGTRWLRSFFTWRVWASIFSLLIPTIIILGGWVYFIHERFHMWSLSTMTGYHMVQHTGNFFEYLPNEYADLRDTYLKYREAHIAEFGTQTNTIWEAIPELQKVSGLTFYDLSRTLATLSIWLIIHHPALFLRNVLEGWWLFWRAPVYWQPDAFRFSILANLVSPLVLLERGLLIVVNLVFVLVSLPTLFIKRLIPAAQQHRIFLYCLLGTVWIGSVIQSILDHGDNPRFLVPMQSLIVIWLLWFVHNIITGRRSGSRYV